MSVGEYSSTSPGRHSSPSNYNEWIARDFPEDLLFDSSYDQPLTLTPEEERLFRSFGDGVASSLGCSLQSTTEPLDERQVVFAEAQAAGLFKGGIRRAAFSMGDLQALQPPEHHSPPSPMAQNQRPPPTTLGASRPPRLESVPESKALPASSASLLGGDLLLNSRISGLSVGGSMSDGTLEGLALDQLSSDLMGESSSCPFDPQGSLQGGFSGAMPMLEERQSVASHPPSAMPSQPVIKQEAGVDNPPLQPVLEHSRDPPANSTQSLPGFFDYSLMNGSRDRKPPLPPPASSSYSPPLVDSDSVIALRGYADELLGSAMPGIPKVPPPGPGGPPPAYIRTGSLDEQKEKEREQQRERMLRRSQSAVDLRSLGSGLPRHGSTGDLTKRQFTVELTTPEGHIYTAGRLSNEERAQKILRYRQKRHERNFNKRIKYMCRKTLADSRPRVRGRFARNDDQAAVMPHETKKALAEKARREKRGAAAKSAQQPDDQLEGSSLLEDSDFSSLIHGSETGARAFQPSGYLPSNEAFNFPPVPMDLYGAETQQGPRK